MIFTDKISLLLDCNQMDVVRSYLNNESAVMSVIGPRGGGKSAALRAILLISALTKKRQILYASQSNGNSMDQFNKLEADPVVRAFVGTGQSNHKPFIRTPYPQITFLNGSTITFWSMQDYESKRGMHPKLMIIDESQSITAHSWNRILFPMSVRVGAACRILCFGSTPDSEDHWSWKLHQKGLKWPNESDVKSFKFLKERALAFKGKAGLAKLAQIQDTMSESAIRVEFDMKPGGQGDTYYKHHVVDKCVKAYPLNYKWKEDVGTIMAFDPALGTQDPPSWLIIDHLGYVIDSYSFPKRTEDTAIIEGLVATAKKYKSLLVVESNALPRDTYIGALKQLMPYGVSDIPMRISGSSANKSKKDMCDSLAWHMEKGLIKINPACTNLIDQIKSIRDYKTPSGSLDIRAPKGDHDDEWACLLIAVEAALKREWKPILNPGRNPFSNPVSSLF